MDTNLLSSLRQRDQSFHLHPFTNHQDMFKEGTHVIDSAQGVYVHDENGKSLLDGLAGLWCTNVGYGRREIADAVYKQMLKVAFYPSFFNTTTEPAVLLAEKIAKLAPPRLKHVFFSNSGTEANETALKLIRGYHKLKGKPAKTKILTLTYGYHGVSLATTSMTRLVSCQAPFDLPLPGFVQVPGPYSYLSGTDMKIDEYAQWCLAETEKIIQSEGRDTIAALFAEPVQGAGGVIVPPPGYVKSLREICRKNQILFVADEVITGFGRLGDWFASNLWDLDPDLISLAKGLTSGYLPLGASVVSDEITDTLVKGGYIAHGSTYSGHTAACAAGLANIEIIEKENLISRTREDTGPYFQKKLQEFAKNPAVGEVRGYGLIAAIELLPREGKSGLDPAKPLGIKAAAIAREEGVIIRGIRDLVAVAPALVITKKEIDTLFGAIDRTLKRLWD